MFGFSHWTARARVLTMLLLASTLPVGVFGTLAALSASRSAEDAASRLLEARADALIDGVDHFNESCLRSAVRTSLWPGIHAALRGEDFDPALLVQLDVALQTDAGLRAISVFDPAGRIVLSTERRAQGMAVPERGYIRCGLQRGACVSDPFIARPLPTPDPLIAYSVRVGDAASPLGLVVFFVYAESLWRNIREESGRAGSGSFAVLYDRHGIRITHSQESTEIFHPGEPLPQAELDALVAEARFGPATRDLLDAVVPAPAEAARARARDLDDMLPFRSILPSKGERNLAVARRAHTTDWTLFLLLPLETVYLSRDAVIRNAVAAAFVIAALAMLIGWTLARGIVEPVRQLAAAAKSVAAGDLSVRVTPQPGAEARALTDAFNDMVSSLRQARDTLEQRVRDRTDELLQANVALDAQRDELMKQQQALRAQGDELEARNVALQRADRLKAEFLANMSHELRTPLNSVLGFSDLVLDSAGDRLLPKERGYMKDVLASGQHLLDLINDLLDLSRIEAGRLQLSPGPQDIAEAAGFVASTLRPQAAQKQMTLDLATDGARPVLADERALRQILMNLVSNAIKFSPTGTRVSVRAEDDGGVDVRVTVSDEGPGIPDELRPRLFEPFVQGESPLIKRHKGTGLGLAITKRLIEAQGGTIELARGQGGASFIVRLPVAGSEPAVATSLGVGRDTLDRIQSLPPGTRSARPQVLLIDDDPRVEPVLRSVLAPAGYDLRVCPDARTGLAAVRDHRPDALILDVVLPDLSGIEALRAIASAAPSLPILVLTAVDLADDELVAFHRHAIAVARKGDLRPDTLLAILDRATGGSSDELAALPKADGRVIVADDHDLNRALARDLLERLGAEVIEAEDGPACVRAALAKRPDLVLLDLAMPGQDGFETLRALRALPGMATLPVVALTALATAADEARVRAAGFDGYLTKPIDRPAFAQTVGRLLG